MTKRPSIPIEEIEITHFIFHVVHHGEDDPILLNKTPIGRFEFFFKKRVSEVINGNSFYFEENSTLLKEIKLIDENILRFVETSKKLAQKFHENKDKRIKPGVMILMRVRIKEIPQFILIKYDHENVLTYTQDGAEAILKEISNTFSKSKSALQKSAIINLQLDQPLAIIVDKSERNNITQFFKEFLGVFRKYNDKVLTEKVRNAFLSTVRTFNETLPTDYTSRASYIFYDLVQKNESFERDNFLERIFGEHYHDEMEVEFDKNLKRNDITGEEFLFDKSLKRPKELKYKTAEGVLIQYSSEAEDTVSIVNEPSQTIITIKTTKLVEQKS